MSEGFRYWRRVLRLAWRGVFIGLIVLVTAPWSARGGEGWYLLLPPARTQVCALFDDSLCYQREIAELEFGLGASSYDWVDPKAPLNAWEHLGAYDTASDCETDRSERTARQIGADDSAFNFFKALGYYERDRSCMTRRSGAELFVSCPGHPTTQVSSVVRSMVKHASFYQQLESSRCVLATDPRLAPKPR